MVLPTYVKLGYVRYVVRPFVQCYNCKKFGHVARVFRMNKHVVVEESDETRCCNCDGNHKSKFPDFPVRMKEVAVVRIRAIQQVCYVEAVKIAEGVSREEMVVDVPQSAVNAKQEKDPDTLIVKKVDFINCTSQTNTKS